MKLLVLRHAIAEDVRKRDAGDAAEDRRRPLTPVGRKRMRRGARGLRKVVDRINVLASSPLLRATQTAEIVRKAYDLPKAVQISQLAPSKSVNGVLHWIALQKPDATIAIVGHEPQLSTFVSWALTGLQESFVVLKKGSAVMLEFEKEIKPGRAKLVWMLKPSQLRALA